MTGNAEAADDARERPVAESRADREATNEEDQRTVAASRAAEADGKAANLYEAERAQRSRDTGTTSARAGCAKRSV